MNWYNDDLKKDFVNQYTGGVADRTFNMIFSKAAKMESVLGKDCSQFTLDEILDLARSFGASDISSVKFKLSLLRTYTNFCINSGFHSTGINHYDDLHSKIYADLIDVRKAAKTYLSDKEVMEIVSQFENPRDKYLILGPYEGIYGKELCELLNLSRHDLLGDNKLKLCTGRTIEVSSTLYGIIEDCLAATTVLYSGRERELEKSDLVYKSVVMKSAYTSASNIKKKFFKMRNYLDRDTFGVRMLYVSGFMNRVRDAVSRHETFEDAREEIEELQKRYQNSYSFASIKLKYDEMMFVLSAVAN